jgi:2-polyprenyl-3-methyl-5-hydroxy-6-metoxy-1,4-benzoquinol methylase
MSLNPTDQKSFKTSGKTAISRKTGSRPAQYWLKERQYRSSTLLDFGCGKGVDAEFLWLKAVPVVGAYDPNLKTVPRYNLVKYTNVCPDVTYADVTMNYVLNTLEPGPRLEALEQAWSLVEHGGRLFVSTRTGTEIEKLAKKNKWVAKEDGWVTGSGTFQKGFDPLALSDLCAELGEFTIVNAGSKNGFTYAWVHKR